MHNRIYHIELESNGCEIFLCLLYELTFVTKSAICVSDSKKFY